MRLYLINPSNDSTEKRAVVVLPHRLGIHPQATWLRRMNPASKKLDTDVIK